MIQRRILIATGIVAVIALLPLLLKLGYIMDILFFVFLYILFSQSFNVMAGYTGLVSIGHATFFGTGALVARFLWSSGLPFYISLIVGGAAATLVSIIIGIPCLRLRGHYFSIGTLALTIIAFLVTQNIFIVESFLPPVHMEHYSTILRYYVALMFAVAATVGVYILANSRLGMGLIAVREDEDAALSMGINTFRCKLKALLMSAFAAGIAGGIYAFYQVGFYYYDGFNPFWSFDPIFITLIGGSGTLFGPILGSVFYVICREVFALTIGAFHIVVFGIIYILIVMFFPQGLAKIWEKVWRAIA